MKKLLDAIYGLAITLIFGTALLADSLVVEILHQVAQVVLDRIAVDDQQVVIRS